MLNFCPSPLILSTSAFFGHRTPTNASCSRDYSRISTEFTHSNASIRLELSASADNSNVQLAPLIPVDPSHHFGFASLIGPSNSGKSTLINRLVGTKVAIVTPKEQTTRCRIAGIMTYGNTQVAYLDTPGIFDGQDRLNRAMVKTAWGTGNEGDTLSIVIDVAEMFYVARKRSQETLHVSETLGMVLDGVAEKRKRRKVGEVCFLANKIDTIEPLERDAVLSKVRTVLTEYGHADPVVFGISALHGVGVDAFTDWVIARMPSGPWHYPEEYATDMNARLIAAEVTREKLMMALKQELPYEIAVETTSYKEQADGSIRITQDIYARRDSQVGIVTGRRGEVVKKVGIKSREELKEILGATVHLMLKVKVKKKWKDDASQYLQWGLDYSA